MVRYVSVALVVFAAAGCRNTTLKCGEGTFKDGGKCVGFDPDDTTPPVTTADQPGGRSRNPIPEELWLTTNEPAMVYYTTDGSEPNETSTQEPPPVLIPHLVNGMEVRYYSVDAAGNQEATQSRLFVQDIQAPGQLSSIVVAAAGTAANVSWTNPTDADLEGVLLAKITLPLDFGVPELGSLYTLGANLSSNLEIVLAGPATDIDVTDLQPGASEYYAAWTYDDLGNYSPSQLIEVQGAIGTVAGSVSVDVAGATVTINTQPTNLVFSGTASYAGGTSTLTVTFNVENGTARTFHNPKLAVSGVSTGTFTPDGTVDGMQYERLGVPSLASAETVSGSLVFTGVGPADTVTFTATLLDHPMMLGHPTGARIQYRNGGLQGQHVNADSGTATIHATLAVPASNSAQGGNQREDFHTSVSSPDGRFMYMGSQHRARIDKMDLFTRASVGGLDIVPGYYRSSVKVAGNAVALYALVSNGHRGGSTWLYRYDPETLQQTGYLDLATGSSTATKIRLTYDGSTVVVVGVGGGMVALVDAWTMEEIDAIPDSFDEIDRLETPGDDARFMAESVDGTMLTFCDRYPGSGVLQFDRRTRTQTIVAMPSSFGGRCWGVESDAQDRVWIGGESGLFVLDPEDGSIIQSAYPYSAQALRRLGDTLYVVRGSRTSVDAVDSSGAVTSTMSVPAGIYRHTLDFTER